MVTNSGGTGVELTDLLADQGLVLPELSSPLQDRLRAIMPGYASARNPVDMTPAWHLFTTVYPGAIEMLARSGEVNAVVPVLLQRSASAEVAAAVRDAVARLRADAVPVPVYVCWVAPRSADEHADVLRTRPGCRALPGLGGPQRWRARRCGADAGLLAGGAGDGTGRPGTGTRTGRPARATRTRRLAGRAARSGQDRGRAVGSEAARTCWWPAESGDRDRVLLQRGIGGGRRRPPGVSRGGEG